MSKQILLFITAIFFLSSCRMADLRPAEIKEETDIWDRESKGRALLRSAAEAQGFNSFYSHSHYRLQIKDHWKGVIGSIANPWPVNNEPITLRYESKTFTGQAEFHEGKHNGEIKGLHSWHYYEIEDKGPIEKKADPNIRYILAAIQYFIELPVRLQDASIVAYAGERKVRGEAYDLVFVTWDQPAPSKDYDHYLLYINKENNLLEYASFTVRDAPGPNPPNIYSTIAFTNFKEIDGATIPFTMRIFNKDPGKPSNYLHKIEVLNFEFDAFPLEKIRPLGTLISPNQKP